MPASAQPVSAIDSLGCPVSVLARNERLQAGRAVVMRKTSRQAMGRVETSGSHRGTLLGIALSGFHRRSIVVGGRQRPYDFGPGQIYLRDFAEPYLADLLTPFDFLLVEIPHGEKGDEAREARRLSSLPQLQAEADPVLPHLAAALLPALADPRAAAALFIDQIVLAMQTHLTGRFGGGRAAFRPRELLSHVQEERAKELLAAHLDGDILVGEVAAACGMSRSSFMRGFRATTGTSPMQWLVALRIEKAKALLAGSALSLAEIGVRCGFADQSHFTRVFSARTGTSPGAWRRNA